MPNRELAIADLLNEFDGVYYDSDLRAFVYFAEAPTDDGLLVEHGVFSNVSRHIASEQVLHTNAEQGVYTGIDGRAVDDPDAVLADPSEWSSMTVMYAKRAVENNVTAEDIGFDNSQGGF